MRFGAVAIEDSLGGVVAHAVKTGGLLLKKGDIVTQRHIESLRALGVETIVVARLDPDDIEEDQAAHAIAGAVAGRNLFPKTPTTGRANLFAACDGVFVAERQFIDAVNAIDDGVTLATLEPMRPVRKGDMVATVKIIPFAISSASLDKAKAAIGGGRLAVAPFTPHRVGVVSTLLPGLKATTVRKTLDVLENRLKPWGSQIAARLETTHETAALAGAIASMRQDIDLIVIFGASAITDRRDVIPAAIEQAGGRVIHLGMPVEPGNLLLLAETADRRPIIGAPGCARSSKANGFDWVLQRLLADLPVTAGDIRQMGAGGLLVEAPAGRKSGVQRNEPPQFDKLAPWGPAATRPPVSLVNHAAAAPGVDSPG
ncbi:molybdopterin-binding protein [Rhodoblastus sp.]|uniref:molybdopterin-binding protein n=1 Tax=Rhodoblastus sp. TaxID=1962975 RepID=UPI0035B3D041